MKAGDLLLNLRLPELQTYSTYSFALISAFDNHGMRVILHYIHGFRNDRCRDNQKKLIRGFNRVEHFKLRNNAKFRYGNRKAKS
uniref:Uncharacterized protein n=1 Tax=Romanomermis culicivorax TaxID=13658 RepID=A0A915KPX2_ROMCU